MTCNLSYGVCSIRFSLPMRFRILSAAFFFGSVLILSGCGGTQGGTWSEPSAVREDFDPQSLNDDDFLIQPPDEAAEVFHPRPAGTKAQSAGPRRKISAPTDRGTAPSPARETAGPIYRIQVAAVATGERAEQVQKEAGQALGLAAYIQQDPPLYKVQVGDFRSKLEAESVLGEVQGKGYRGAFLVSVSGLRPTARPSESKASESPPEAMEQKPVVQLVPAQGYRVQIYSVADRDDSQRFYEEVRKRLNREDVYLQFEPPFFRVRVGNCRTRDEAEDLVRMLEQAGYEAPFPVRTQILVPEAAKTRNE